MGDGLELVLTKGNREEIGVTTVFGMEGKDAVEREADGGVVRDGSMERLEARVLKGQMDVMREEYRQGRDSVALPQIHVDCCS